MERVTILTSNQIQSVINGSYFWFLSVWFSFPGFGVGEKWFWLQLPILRFKIGCEMNSWFTRKKTKEEPDPKKRKDSHKECRKEKMKMKRRGKKRKKNSLCLWTETKKINRGKGKKMEKWNDDDNSGGKRRIESKHESYLLYFFLHLLLNFSKRVLSPLPLHGLGSSLHSANQMHSSWWWSSGGRIRNFSNFFSIPLWIPPLHFFLFSFSWSSCRSRSSASIPKNKNWIPDTHKFPHLPT